MFIQRRPLSPNRTFKFFHAAINYQLLGKGKPIILLHGAISSQSWNGFDRLLSKYFQVYRPELPGFGASQTVNNRIHDTNLFAEVLTRFIKINHLKKAPIIALSLGTIVALKTALDGGTEGRLILIGVPTKAFGVQFRLINNLPLFLKRTIVSTKFARKKILLPILRENLGVPKASGRQYDQELFQMMMATDSKAIADPNYYQDITQNIPLLINRVKNDTVYIYGENDPQKMNFKNFGKSYIAIPKLGHNIFTDNPSLSLSIIKKYL